MMLSTTGWGLRAQHVYADTVMPFSAWLSNQRQFGCCFTPLFQCAMPLWVVLIALGIMLVVAEIDKQNSDDDDSLN